MDQSLVEFAAIAFVTILAALGGGWCGYELARRRDDRYKATELAMKVFGDKITGKRLDFRQKLSEPDIDLKALVSSPDLACESCRAQILSVMNQYDLICFLRQNGHLDETVFNEYLKPIIRSDYDLTDDFHRELEIHMLHNGLDEKRPFFPSIANMVGRTSPLDRL